MCVWPGVDKLMIMGNQQTMDAMKINNWDYPANWWYCVSVLNDGQTYLFNFRCFNACQFLSLFDDVFWLQISSYVNKIHHFSRIYINKNA